MAVQNPLGDPADQSFEVGRASAYSLSMSLLGLAAIVIYLRLQARREKV